MTFILKYTFLYIFKFFKYAKLPHKYDDKFRITAL